jgi:putative copper export protein
VSGVMLVAAVVRWFEFVAFAVLAGAAGLGVAVLPPGGPEVDRVRDAVRRNARLAALVLLVASAAELALRTWILVGGGLRASLAALPTVLARTHFGACWIVRAAALALLWGLLRLERRLALRMGLVAVAAVALTTSLTGHAGDRGDVTFRVLADWVHVLASGVWTGGLLCLAPAAWRGEALAGRLDEVAHAFSRLAGICLLGVLTSGAVDAWYGLGELSALWSTGYGRLLALKLAFVTGLVGLGAENRYRVLPALRPGDRIGLAARAFRAVRRSMGAAPVAAEEGFRRLVVREAGLALVVFACTAFLVGSTPPRHAAPHLHPVASSRPRLPPGPETHVRTRRVSPAADRAERGGDHPGKSPDSRGSVRREMTPGGGRLPPCLLQGTSNAASLGRRRCRRNERPPSPARWGRETRPWGGEAQPGTKARGDGAGMRAP